MSAMSNFKETSKAANQKGEQVLHLRMASQAPKKRFSTLTTSDASFKNEQQLITKKLLDTYLSQHNFITRSDYSVFTGLLKNKALDDLKEWVSQGLLIKQDMRSQIIFTQA